jgi:predicted HAD superfamily hydrolase
MYFIFVLLKKNQKIHSKMAKYFLFFSQISKKPSKYLETNMDFALPAAQTTAQHKSIL